MKQLYEKINASMPMLQEVDEIIWAASEVEKHLGGPAKTFVEFGSYTGASFTFYSIAAAFSTCKSRIAVDPNLHEGTFQHDKVEKYLGGNYIFIEESTLICHDSLLVALNGIKIDLAHIDSVHLASHTEQEWAILEPLMNSPSVLIVHDIKPGWRQSDYPGYLGQNIRQLSTGDWWQRIKFDYSYAEKKINGPHPDMGVGLLLL